MKRYLATLSRFWPLALLPVIVVPLIAGALFLRSSGANVSANVWVTYASLRQVGYDDTSQVPSQNLANGLTQLVASSSFDRQIVSSSHLYAHAASSRPSGWAQADLKKNLTFKPGGPNLLVVSYAGSDYAIATQVLQAFLARAPRELDTLNQAYTGPGPFRVVDSPSPSTAGSSKKTELEVLGIALVLGLLLGGTFVVVRTALDHSVRFAEEVPDLFDLPLLITVPLTGKSAQPPTSGPQTARGA
jgi:hypothetical protein